jgi:hypothetical protein
LKVSEGLEGSFLLLKLLLALSIQSVHRSINHCLILANAGKLTTVSQQEKLLELRI